MFASYSGDSYILKVISESEAKTVESQLEKKKKKKKGGCLNISFLVLIACMIIEYISEKLSDLQTFHFIL
mgnify:CR=1 FL=1